LGGGPLIGTCGFNVLELDRGRRGEIAYDLARKDWGRGVMSEILPALLTYGYDKLGLRRIEASVTPGNMRSCRLLERNGFRCEARLRDHGYWKGRFWDQLIYGRVGGVPPATLGPVNPARPPNLAVKPLTLSDAASVLRLYRRAAAGPGGLARRPEEIDAAYVEGFIGKALAGGVALGAWSPDGATLCGEIHAGRIGPAQFAHVLSDLTVAVDPDWQGRGVGSTLFKALFAQAATLTPRVERIELMAREGNADAVRLYQRLEFEIEGRFAGRVRLPDGTLEADLAMGLILPDGD
jgi:putative acetyltransferase